MSVLLWSLGSTFAVSLLSLIGIFTFSLKDKLLRRLLLFLVAFSAGALLGGAFLHLIPEAIEATAIMPVTFYLLVGFSLFFIVERLLHWHHCHDGKCDVHTFTYMTLIGDTVHNFIDGLIIVASYIISVPVGIASTFAIIAHEVPQEIGDFAILVHGGFTKSKALLFNFLTALAAILGALVGYFLSEISEKFLEFLIPFAAGGFIYVAASDLIPQLHKDPDLRKSLASFLFFLAGLVFMYAIKVIFE